MNSYNALKKSMAMEKASRAASILLQFLALCWKTARSISIWSTLAMIFLPALLVMLLGNMDLSPKKSLDDSAHEFELQFKLCSSSSHKFTLFYHAPTNNNSVDVNFVERVMGRFASEQAFAAKSASCDLQFNVLKTANEYDFANSLLNFRLKNLQLYGARPHVAGVHFNAANSTHVHYKVFSPKHRMELEFALDSAIWSVSSADYKSAGPSFTIETYEVKANDGKPVEIKEKDNKGPLLPSDFFEMIPKSILPIILLCVGLVFTNFAFLFTPMFMVITEKRNNLISLLRQMNMKESLYWLSYVCVFALINLFSSLMLTIYLKEWSGLNKTLLTIEFGKAFSAIFSSNLLVVGFALFLGSCLRAPAKVNLALACLTSIGIIIAILGVMGELGKVDIPGRDMHSPTIMKGYLYLGQGLYYNDNVFYFLSLFFPFFPLVKFFCNAIILTFYDLYVPYDSVLRTVTKFSEIIKSLKAENDMLPGLAFGGMAIYVILAWYCLLVFGNADVSQKLGVFFFLKPSYYVSKKEEKAVEAGDRVAALQQQSLANSSIVIHKLSKSYGAGNTAVKEFTTEWKKGSCHVILGPNGSGKSTLVRMLSATFPPSHGNAFLFGHSVRTDSTAINECTSTCYQEDVLFDGMTGLDHVIFFSLFRGVNLFAISNIREWAKGLLAKVNLDGPAAFRPTAAYSGGMKRRLCILLATSVGNPDVIFLDEPTTGLDPLNRRKAWNLIQESKKDRILLLTTHSMEEADALGDDISIMSRGRLVAAGSSLFLKNHYGCGFQIKIVNSSKNPQVLNALEELAKSVVTSCKTISKISDTLTLSVPRYSFKSLVTLLRDLHELENFKLQSDDSDFKEAVSASTNLEWSISNTTLEQVFMAVAKSEKSVVLEDSAESAGAALNSTVPLCVICRKNEAEENIFLFTSKGLEVKLPHVLCKRCAKQEDAQIIANELAEVEGEPIPNEETDIDALKKRIKFAGSEVQKSASVSAPENSSSTLNRRIPAEAGNLRLFTNQVSATFLKNWYFEKKAKKMNICLIVASLLIVILIIFMGIGSSISKSSTNVSRNNVIENLLSELRSGSAYEGTSYYYNYYNPSGIDLKFPEKYLNGVDKNVTVPIRLKNPNDPWPLFGSYLVLLKYEMPFKFRCYYKYSGCGFELTSFIREHINYAVGLTVTSNGANIRGLELRADVGMKIAAVVIILMGLFYIPRMVELILYEKNEKIYYFLRIAGLKSINYWLGNLLFYSSFLFGTSMINFLILGAIILFKSGVPFGIVTVFSLINSICVVSMSFFLGALVPGKKRVLGAILSYVLVMVLGAVPCLSILMDGFANVIESPHFALIPTVPAGVFLARLLSTDGYKFTEQDARLLGFMVLNAIIYFVAAFLIMETGIYSGRLWEKLFSRIPKAKKNALNDLELSEATITFDEDVIATEKSIRSNQAEIVKNSSVVLVNLSKTFNKGKSMVLDKIFLHIPKGECLALLGQNGCGKTTLLSILLGLGEASGGSFFINGKNKNTGLEVGVCPQFDALYGEMTVEEHLRIYARLRGATSSNINAWIQEIAELVNLDGDAFEMKSCGLSGGMKRRLSIALALIGIPSIVYLDEPTTGIDPENRQEVWRIVEKIKKYNETVANPTTVIFTTHYMDEADALSDRIAVLANGKFQGIGTSNHLKKKFGNGYRLTCLLNQSADKDEVASHQGKCAVEDKGIEAVIEAVMCHADEIGISKVECEFSSSKEVMRSRTQELLMQNGSLAWKVQVGFLIKAISYETFNLAALFEAVKEKAVHLHIAEWAISPATMEDVFIRLTSCHEST